MAAEVEPGVPVRASQTGLMAFILTYIRARGRKRPQAEAEEVREAEEVTEVKEIKEVEGRSQRGAPFRFAYSRSSRGLDGWQRHLRGVLS